jgi:Trypsin
MGTNKNTILSTNQNLSCRYINIEVHLGAQEIYDEAEPNRQIFVTRNYTVHQNFNEDTLDNDIAVVRMIQGVTGTGISTVRLPSRSQVGTTFTGERARVSGWGRVSDCEFITLFCLGVIQNFFPNYLVFYDK